MKRILVTAGGTATAWHITQTAKEFFPHELEIQVCDTNEPEYVPAVTSAAKVHKVPPVISPDYPDMIGMIIDDEHINCIIPLIPREAYLFAGDGDFIKQHNVLSAAPELKTTELLADKQNMYKTLTSLGIPTPRVYTKDELSDSEIYLLKPRLGFGSSGIRVIHGNEPVPDDCVVQEYCHGDDYDEITVEIYNGKAGLHIFARRRVATKAGVCVKMEPVDPAPFFPYIQKLVTSVACPAAFNVQFLQNEGEWKLFDCNLRPGAGTALSTAAGFQLVRAFLAELAGLPVDEEWFRIDDSVRTVLRVYQEIVVR